MSDLKWLVTFQCPACGRAWPDALTAQQPVAVRACPDCGESKVQLSAVRPLGVADAHGASQEHP